MYGSNRSCASRDNLMSTDGLNRTESLSTQLELARPLLKLLISQMSSLSSSQNQDDVQSGLECLSISVYDSFLIQDSSSRGTEYAATSNEPTNEAKPGATSGNVDLEEETPSLPQISNDFGLDLDSIISAGDPEYAIVQLEALPF